MADGTCSNDEYTIIPRNPHTRQTVEEAVTEELVKPSVEEKPLKPTQSGDAISGNAHRGKVLEETEETGLESGNGQDPLTQDNNSPPDSPELNLGLNDRDTHQQFWRTTHLAIPHIWDPSYCTHHSRQQCIWKSITSVRYFSSSLENRFTDCTAVPATPIPTFDPVSSNPSLLGNVPAVSNHASTCVPAGKPVPCSLNYHVSAKEWSDVSTRNHELWARTCARLCVLNELLVNYFVCKKKNALRSPSDSLC